MIDKFGRSLVHKKLKSEEAIKKLERNISQQQATIDQHFFVTLHIFSTSLGIKDPGNKFALYKLYNIDNFNHYEIPFDVVELADASIPSGLGVATYNPTTSKLTFYKDVKTVPYKRRVKISFYTNNLKNPAMLVTTLVFKCKK